MSMDPKAPKPHSKRVGQDPDHLSSRRPNRLFLSETVPPASHQPQSSPNRSHNLSDRIHEYYDKLVKNSPLKRTYRPSESHQFPARNLHQRFGDPYLLDRSAVTVPRYGEPVSIHSPMLPVNTQPYTVYVEDPTAALQHYNKRKQSPSSHTGSAYLDTSDKSNECAPDSAGTRVVRERSKSPLINRTQCALCHSSNHSLQNCSLQSRVPAEHDGFFSDPVHGGGSPPIRHPKVVNENQGDGSEDKKATSSFPKKRSIPANINVRCERDVIGQEKSPVSKSHPVGSAALSTSSSNGDTVPRERKKWVRPPLVGQAASSAEKSPFINFDCLDDHSHSLEKSKTSNDGLQLSSSTGSSDQTDTRFPHPKSSYFNPSNSASQNNDDFYEAADRDVAACQQLTSEGEQGLSDSCVGGRISPSSSVTSSRRLEWDSGADVGYNQMYSSPNPGVSTSGLCTIERMALAQGCSAALHLRLDPEGTTVPATPGTALTSSVLPSPLQDKPTSCPMGKPTAESTPVDQLPFIARALNRYRNDPKSVISPIYHTNKKDCGEPQGLSGPLHEEEEEEADMDNVNLNIPKSKSPDGQGSSDASTIPMHRQLSNSMQDLRKCSNKVPENQLLKSQSDPDLSGDMPTVVSKTVKSKLLKGIPRGENFVESHVAGHSISSGSDATLVHVGTEEDLAIDEEGDSTEHPVAPKSTKVQDDIKLSETEDLISVSVAVSESGKVSALAEQENTSKSSIVQPISEKKENAPAQPKQNKPSSNLHVCSDSDHKRGLHHHFGVLCSTVLGGHIQSSTQANAGTQLENVVQGSDRVYSVNENQNEQQSRESTQSPNQDSEIFTGESTESSAFHSDTAHEEAPCASTLTGRVNSFEYLPGHVYESNSTGLRKHERPPGISTSTETDSEPVRPMSRAMHRKVVESSSHDTEDERLWGSPRAGSNTLVQDLERGVHLLKGVMENKSAGRRCKRELVRRIIKKLVTSEYVEDMIEKERVRHQARSPFSPRKSKYQERQDKNLRSKRTVGLERREISGESDEPKQRVHNVRRKLPTHQPAHPPQVPRTLSTLASGSKSSSLWSSHADSTSDSISLSGSSANQNKASKLSVKTNPLHEQPQEEKPVDWLQPATQSEKIFEMRKNGVSQAEKHLAGLIGVHGQESAIDPVAFKNDPQQQLSWVTKEINHLKILKQLLQKQEYLKQSLDPNLCQTNFTTMPVTRLKQTMQMADCTSPDIPESHSPSLKAPRRHPRISLESDTSAGFGLSNNTGSSRDSHWQEVEVASAGEQDSHPHRTVSISDASCSLSNQKSDVSHSSGPQIAQKSRRRSVSISDTDQQLGPPAAFDAPIQKKRSDCQCGKPDSRVYTARPVQIGTYGPPPRNPISENNTKQICDNCTAHRHQMRREAPASAGALRSVLTTRGGPLVMPSSDTVSHQSADGTQKPQSCSCGPARVQAKNCCCSSGQTAGPSSQNAGAIRKGTSGSSHQLVSRVVAEVPSSSTQALTGGGLVRVHIETDQDLDSAHGRSESLRSSDRAVADIPPIVRQGSDDSITKAVTEAVSCKVKALRNLGQIEEAEVKIRVKVAPGQVSDSVTSHSERGRVLKTQDLEDEGSFYPSKHSEMEDMIARQRAMDIETRQKLLAIAESRQRAQMSLNDVDRRIQDILLQDYLSRQFKTPETSSAPHARLNVHVEAPVMQGSSVGVQSEVDKKTIGTSTLLHLESSVSQRKNQSYRSAVPLQQEPASSSQGGCICGSTPYGQPQSVMNQGQQTETLARPQTAPVSRLCCCQSQPATSGRTYHGSPPFSLPERQMEFELDLRKQRPCKLTPYDVHEALKSRNTAYFLQFQEDDSLKTEPKKEESKPAMEVVTVKIPMHKPTGVKPTLSSQKSRKSSTKNKMARAPSPGGTSQSESLVNSRNQRQRSGSESPSDAANLLRNTPGRSHFSITITDSSAGSIHSPKSDSRYSSFPHPSRKPHKSPRPNRREKVLTGGRGKGDISQTIVFGTDDSKSPSSPMSAQSMAQQGPSVKQHPANESESSYDHHGDDGENVPTLQEYLERNHPKYLDAAEKRRRCIAEMTYLRRLRQQSRKRLMALEGDNMCAKQKQQWRARCASRPKPAFKKRPMPTSTKSACARRYMFLPEGQQRLAELKKREEKRTNRLMAEIYTRKLQEKVLRGSATIRSSVSVISSI